jgi:hypothetical protein
VPDAGGILPATLAHHLGLGAMVDGLLDLGAGSADRGVLAEWVDGHGRSTGSQTIGPAAVARISGMGGELRGPGSTTTSGPADVGRDVR